MHLYPPKQINTKIRSAFDKLAKQEIRYFFTQQAKTQLYLTVSKPKYKIPLKLKVHYIQSNFFAVCMRFVKIIENVYFRDSSVYPKDGRSLKNLNICDRISGYCSEVLQYLVYKI